MARTINPRTFRISGIPTGVTEELMAYLNSVLENSASDEVIISLVPYSHGKKKIATVTFTSSEPPPFSECKPGDRMPLYVKEMNAHVVVDCDFLGITPLFSSAEPTVDIIAVTGLAGHAFGSWKSRTQPQMWLRDFLPEDMQDIGIRVLTFGYNSKLRNSTSTSSIQQFSRQLMDGERFRPLIFVAHSLGGLVVKQVGDDGNWERSGGMIRMVTQESATLHQSVNAAPGIIANRLASVKNHDASPEPLFLVPFCGNPNFVGREDIWHQLESLLKPTSNRQQKAALWGLGGIGKTTIAVEFCYRRKRAQPRTHILWVHGNSDKTCRASYLHLCQEAGLAKNNDQANEDTLLNRLKIWLDSTNSGEWIMVIDNLDDIDLEFKKTLLTLLDNLPLAIAQAAAYIRLTRMPIAEYVETFRECEKNQQQFLSEALQSERLSDLDVRDSRASIARVSPPPDITGSTGYEPGCFHLDRPLRHKRTWSTTSLLVKISTAVSTPILKLTEHNYRTWVVEAKDLLKHLNVWQIVDGSEIIPVPPAAPAASGSSWSTAAPDPLDPEYDFKPESQDSAYLNRFNNILQDWRTYKNNYEKANGTICSLL
ncbi:hypothetical protein K440DRAFT_641239 [Wilcoxina mikolae CBS 423.85]|nr:hypothetical protein K440DRAFT_641239 [Wilcoxina mikolae CBS 423.85]